MCCQLALWGYLKVRKKLSVLQLCHTTLTVLGTDEALCSISRANKGEGALIGEP